MEAYKFKTKVSENGTIVLPEELDVKNKEVEVIILEDGSSITDIYYIVKKNAGHTKAIETIESLLATVDILNVNRDTIFLALHSNFADFEDAMQNASAELSNVDLIISRNIQDFNRSKIPVQTPSDFLKNYKNN
ncbi:PIN domain-containing protein [Pedobacter sp. MW01-1-1]|uniref:PIN domain-containing protein n=1 Tax=Pedobacter sp. MW01-1-1 TaxID=3383027 RepID=UPI003FEF0287